MSDLARMRELSNTVCIVGVDESDEMGTLPNKSMLSLHVEAVRNAVRDAGLKISDVDGVWDAVGLLKDDKVRDLLTNRTDKTVYIKSDKRAKWSKVEDVIDNLRAAGVDELGMLTESRNASQAAAN